MKNLLRPFSILVLTIQKQGNCAKTRVTQCTAFCVILSLEASIRLVITQLTMVLIPKYQTK